MMKMINLRQNQKRKKQKKPNCSLFVHVQQIYHIFSAFLFVSFVVHFYQKGVNRTDKTDKQVLQIQILSKKEENIRGENKARKRKKLLFTLRFFVEQNVLLFFFFHSV